jgi:hypothetical protein
MSKKHIIPQLWVPGLVINNNETPVYQSSQTQAFKQVFELLEALNIKNEDNDSDKMESLFVLSVRKSGSVRFFGPILTDHNQNRLPIIEIFQKTGPDCKKTGPNQFFSV